MRFSDPQKFRNLPFKAIALLGMSGVGKTTLAGLLPEKNWLHYSVDYRIGVHYMKEHIAGGFSPVNLAPLTNYLGKPGDPVKNGLCFSEYKKRQKQHYLAETSALLDVSYFTMQARTLRPPSNFVCDTGGSLCEVVNPYDQDDPILTCLANETVLLYVEGNSAQISLLIDRFRKNPKPIYYRPDFLERAWGAYGKVYNIRHEKDVDPDDFILWSFEELIRHRLQLYDIIARNFGYRVTMEEVAMMRNESDIIDCIVQAIERQNHGAH